MQTNPAVEQSEIIRWSERPRNMSGRKEKGLWGKGFGFQSGNCCERVVMQASLMVGICWNCDLSYNDDTLSLR